MEDSVTRPALNPNSPPQPIVGPTLPLDVRFEVKNPDGSISTVRTISIGTDQGEVLIPTVIGGKVVTDDEAVNHFYKTGEHFGVFDTPDNATRYAEWLHSQHEAKMQQKPIGAILGERN